MRATHQFFLSQRTIYLFVLNGREGSADLDAKYWLKLIESFGGESPIIIVLTSLRSRPLTLIVGVCNKSIPQSETFVITDRADGTGRNDLLKVIERETDRLDSLPRTLPAPGSRDSSAGAGGYSRAAMPR